jgi:hypothetical protein
MNSQGAEALHSTYPESMVQYPDYSKGPSALDKASQLFFFTEILRGEWVALNTWGVESHPHPAPFPLFVFFTWKTSSDLLTLSCTHSKRDLSALGSVVNTPFDDTPLEKKGVLVSNRSGNDL